MENAFKVGDIVVRNHELARDDGAEMFYTSDPCVVTKVMGNLLCVDGKPEPWASKYFTITGHVGTQSTTLPKEHPAKLSDHQRNILQAMLDGKTIEVYYRGKWVEDDRVLRNMVNRCEHRIKPETVTINGVEVPAPITELPNGLTKFWVPSILHTDGVVCLNPIYVGPRYVNMCIERGLAHLTEENAKKHSDALIKPTTKE